MSCSGQPRSVCLLTSSHPVNYSRFLDREAVSLARAGYSVTLIGLGEHGRVPGPAGVSLLPVSGRRLVLKPVTLYRICALAREVRAAVYQCLDPWTLQVWLWLRRSGLNPRLVYEASEWFPKMELERPDLPRPLRWAIHVCVTQLEERAGAMAEAIVETNSTRAQRFVSAGREPVLVPNYPRIEDLPEPVAHRRPCFVYTGLVSRHRCFDVILRALALVVRQRPEARLRVIGGYDPRDSLREWVAEFVGQSGLAGNIEMLGWLPYRQMFDAIRDCLAGFVLLRPERTNDYTGQPNKLFEFMGSGLAVICPDFPEIGPVVRAHECGWTVESTSPSAVAEAMELALANPQGSVQRGDAGRRAVLQQYNWGVAERALLELYKRILPLR